MVECEVCWCVVGFQCFVYVEEVWEVFWEFFEVGFFECGFVVCYVVVIGCDGNVELVVVLYVGFGCGVGLVVVFFVEIIGNVVYFQYFGGEELWQCMQILGEIEI